MHIIKVGISHQTASLEVREKLSFSEETVKMAMLALQERHGISENIIISTCNRTEIFVVTENANSATSSIQHFLADWFQLSSHDFSMFFSSLEDEDAIDHLFKLATGLDSMVIGETQILGQVRNAFLAAQASGTSQKIFNELFKRVITFAKRAHRDTGIGEQAVSISYAAVELSRKFFGNIRGKHIVILGAGETSELTLRNLQGAGVSRITVVNRTLERAEKLADEFSAEAVPAEDLPDILKKADILISSTASTAPVLIKEQLQNILKQREGKPLFLIDLAVPRDIDPQVAELDGVYLYNIDDLHRVVNENIETRKKAAHLIEQKLVVEMISFNHWLEMLDAIPVIRALQEKATMIQETTLESIYRKMPDLTEREMKVLKKHTKSIVQQLLKEPINHVKNIGGEEEELKMVRLIFGLHDEISKQIH